MTLIAGAGVVVVFGFLLLGLKFADARGTDGTQGTTAHTGQDEARADPPGTSSQSDPARKIPTFDLES